MQEAKRLNKDVSIIRDFAEVPGIGFLPVNSFVLHAAQPLVVDTGLSVPDRNYVERLAEVIDPADVEWIFLTHPDKDHTGGLFALLEAAPNAKLITTFVGVGIMSTEVAPPLPRCYLLNPGQSLDLGDRSITAIRPPLFDSAATVAFFDNSTGTFFSSDCFGAPMESAEAALSDEVPVTGGELAQRQGLWTSVDSPWVANADPARFAMTLEPIRQFDPSLILSTHLPPAAGMTSDFLTTAAMAPGITPFVGPDQAALMELLKQFEPA